MDVCKDHSGEMIGKDHFIEKLGKGFLGVVYSVEDCILHSKKAIKIISVTNPNHAQALFEEAAIPYKFRHNNIVQINGGSLEDLIRSGRLSIADTLKYIRDTLFALQHSHTQNIVHRDIKPANIRISNGIADPSKRYISASEMRDDIEKFKIILSWVKESDSAWLGMSKKEIRRVEIIPKKKSYNVDIKINGKKSGKESSIFSSTLKPSTKACSM